MCKIMEDFAKEVKQENQEETAKRFLSMGLSMEQVAIGTGLSLDEVKRLAVANKD